MVVAILFIKCTKDTQDAKLIVATEADNLKSNSNRESASTNKVAGANCIVPIGFTSCSSTCTFSDCCVVWNPNKETGGCGCFFGISTCKTAAIEQTAATATRTIVIHQDKLKEFFKFCKATGISTEQIQLSYSEKLMPAVIEGDAINAKVKNEGYDLFVEDYKLFINALSENQKTKLKNYIK